MNTAPAQNQINFLCRSVKTESFLRNDWRNAQSATATTNTPAYSPPPENRGEPPPRASAQPGSLWWSDQPGVSPTFPQYTPPSNQLRSTSIFLGGSMR